MTVDVDIPLDKKPTNLPVDRGWAWVIALASIGLFGSVAGGLRAMGVVYVEAVEHFGHENEQMLLWVFGLLAPVAMVTSPLTAILVEHTSYRTSFLIGSSLMAVGLILGALVPRAEYLFCTLSLFYGVGGGLVITPCFLVTAPYFDKYKGLAVGITCAGSGTGLLIMPHILRALFSNYGYMGALLIYGGMFLNFICLAMLMRPFSFYDRSPKKESPSCEENDGEIIGSHLTVGSNLEKSNGHLLRARHHEGRQVTKSLLDLPANFDKQHIYGSSELTGALALSVSQMSLHNNRSSKKDKLSGETSDGQPSLMVRALKDYRVWLVSLMLCFINMGYSTVYLIIPRLAQENGVDKSMVALLLSIGGVCEVIGRFSAGWVADRKWFSALTQTGVCMLIAGTLICISLSVDSTVGVGMQAMSLGFFASTAYTLQPAVLHQEIDPELIGMALGVVFGAQAPAMSIPVIIIGSIFEATGSYVVPMLYVGVCFYVGAAMALVWSVSKKFKCSKFRK